MACAVEDAGFEIRDTIQWLYGSGFPKSLNVGKAMDKAAGATREVVGESPYAARKPHGTWTGNVYGDEPSHGTGPQVTAPATAEAEQWDGWGTALKPAHEPIVLARKPLIGTVANNVLAHGTGALNIDASRIEHTTINGGNLADNPHLRESINGGNGGNIFPTETERRVVTPHQQGRWPANVILSHSEGCVEVGTKKIKAITWECVSDCPVVELDAQSGTSKSPPVGSVANTQGGQTIGTFAHAGRPPSPNGHGDSGGASRFFYTPKAPKKERPVAPDGTKHPTVKSLALMRYLIRLVTPPGGTVLDPFAGSGTTGEAAALEGFRCVMVEREPTYVPLIEHRATRVGLDLRVVDMTESS